MLKIKNTKPKPKPKLENQKIRITLKADPDNVTIQDGKKIILAQTEINVHITDKNYIYIAKKINDLKHKMIDEHIEIVVEKIDI